MGVKFGMEEGTLPLLHAKFHPHRCNVSPLWGEKPQNRPLSKLNTGRFALRAMLPVIILHLPPNLVEVRQTRGERRGSLGRRLVHQWFSASVVQCIWMPRVLLKLQLIVVPPVDTADPRIIYSSFVPLSTFCMLKEWHLIQWLHPKFRTAILVYCGQTVGWIKIPLGMEVGLGPGDIVLDWDPVPLKRGTAPPILGPYLLWPNGWMDQDATWYGGRSWPSPHWVRWGPSSLLQKGVQQPPPLFGPCLLWPNRHPSQLLLIT